MMAQEPWVHEWILRETSRGGASPVPVAEVLAYDDSRDAVPRDVLVTECLPGVPLSEARPTPEQRGRALRQTGGALARVHSLTHDSYGYVGPHHPMEARATWREAFHAMWNKLLDDVEACGAYSTKEAGLFRALLDARLDAFAEKPASLLHMDVWDQNLLVDGEGNLTGIVDWDRALCGDPEIEFAVLDYCGISEPAFWEGYNAARGEPGLGDADPRDVEPLAATRHFFYYLYELQKYIVINQLRARRPARAAYYKRSAFRVVAQLLDRAGEEGREFG
ncbi:MAG: phosphotransferase family protein [Promethearchaeota archaeon]